MSYVLSKKLKGRLLLPEHHEYNERRKVFNGGIERYPKAIAVCLTEEDVRAAVTFARTEILTISVRGGGHHVAGTAVCDHGLMIDLSEMRNVDVDTDRKIAYVEGGAILRDIDMETQKYGLATPTGTVSQTGIGGLALGGGLGYLRGKYGLTSDNLLSARIVTADGKLLEVSSKHHQDLFWALRGGGGNFGIVTQFALKLHEIGPNILGLDVMYDFKDAGEVLRKAQAYIKDAPDEVSFNITAMQLPPAPFLPDFLHHRKVISLTGMYAGDPEEGESVLMPLRNITKPVVDQSGVFPYTELQSKLDAMVESNIPVYGTSLYFSSLDDRVINKILTKLDQAPSSSILVQLWALNGEMNRVPVDETAFAVRDAAFVLFIDAMVMPDMDAEVLKNWVESVYHELLPYSHLNASYLNGIGLGDSITKRAYGLNF
ncbi:FAD-binding oxidoreductase [Salinibacillus aidingensis]|uniref:FAD-binding oxidoreductase n=1 Tax=Salinibacillus aidingensis TaxID=237684 RepID=A0ABP3KVX7_9BACI